MQPRNARRCTSPRRARATSVKLPRWAESLIEKAIAAKYGRGVRGKRTEVILDAIWATHGHLAGKREMPTTAELVRLRGRQPNIVPSARVAAELARRSTNPR